MILPAPAQFLIYLTGLLFLLFASTPNASAKALTTNPDILQKKLEQFFTQNLVAQNAGNIELNALRQFYTLRKYQPAWIQSDSQLSRLNTALSFIATAEDEGLNSQDYQLQRLMHLSAHLSTSTQYDLEFLTTLSLLQYATDLYRGRFRVAEIDPDWHIPQPEFDAVGFFIKIHRFR